MPPQITCPHCGSTINLENRKEVDFEKILHALGKSPRTFTELLTMTNLPRKTLSIRLKELCASGSIIKDGGYHLNPSNVSASGTFSKRNRNGKMNPTILHIKKNVQWIPVALIACLIVVAFGSAMMVSPPAPRQSPPTASFFYFPSNIVVGGVLTFDGALSRSSNGPITDYTWDFGDGSPLAYGQKVTHAYVAEGTYTITLTVNDAHGLTTRTQETLDVSPAAKIFVESLPSQYVIGNNITLKIVISNVADLWCWGAGMTFDSSVLECITTANPLNVAPNATTPITAFTEGSFLKSGGSTVWIPNSVTNGMIGSCGCSILYPGTPVSGSGVLATVTFKVIGQGNLDIHLVDVCLVDINGSEIPVSVAT
jgi:hypothetical protein